MGSSTTLDLESSPYHMLCSKRGCRGDPGEQETEALQPLGSDGHGWQGLDPTPSSGPN